MAIGARDRRKGPRRDRRQHDQALLLDQSGDVVRRAVQQQCVAHREAHHRQAHVERRAASVQRHGIDAKAPSPVQTPNHFVKSPSIRPHQNLDYGGAPGRRRLGAGNRLSRHCAVAEPHEFGLISGKHDDIARLERGIVQHLTM